MLKSKKLCAVLSIIVCLLQAPAVFAAPPVKVFINGNEVVYDVPAQIISGHTMVPLSQTIQSITGSNAEWNSVTKTVTFNANGHKNVHKIGEKIVYVDGTPKYFDSPSMILNNRTLVPIRMIAEVSGCKVDWDGANRYVIITGKPSSHAVSIYGATASKSTVKEGDPTILTIRTNSDAKYVWVEHSNRTENAKYVSTDSAGVKTWTATCYPLRTGQMIIRANNENKIASAITYPINITVTPKASALEINGLSASSTSIYEGDEITITIKTSSAANNVWVEYDDTSVNAKYQSTDSSGSKTWGATCFPSETQRINVYANTSGTASGAVSDSVRITVNHIPAPSAKPVINSSSYYASVDSVTLTIVTNTIVEQVDITAGRFGTETLYSADTSGNTKTWTYYFDVPLGFYGSEITFSIVAYGNDQNARDRVTASLK